MEEIYVCVDGGYPTRCNLKKVPKVGEFIQGYEVLDVTYILGIYQVQVTKV